MATALMVVNGVLRDDQKRPIPEGIALFHALSQGYRVALAVEDKIVDAHWLMMEGLTVYQELIDENVPGALRGQEETLSQVEYLLGRGQQVSLVVLANPQSAAFVVERGVTVSLFVHPRFTRPEYRPDWNGGMRRWDDIVTEIETQKRLEIERRPPEDS